MYEYSSFVCMSHILRLSGCTRWLVADIFNTYVCRCASASTVSTLFLHFKVPCRPSSLDLSHTHTAIHAGTLWRCNVNGPVARSPGRLSRRLPLVRLPAALRVDLQPTLCAAAVACIFAHYTAESFSRLHT